MTEKYDEKRLTVPYEWRIKYLLQDSFNGLPEKKIQFCFALFFLKMRFSPLFIVCEILCNWLALRKGDLTYFKLRTAIFRRRGARNDL